MIIRKLISIVLVLALVTMLSGVAKAMEADETLVPVEFTSSGEEKVYCKATVEDDFAENRVMVVMSNAASLDFRSFEAADFSEIDYAGVQDLSQASGRKIQAKAEALKAAVMTRSVDASTLDTSGIDTYNQVLCLELEEDGKENVLAAIEELMKRDDVVYAGPDYVLTLCATEPNDEYYNHDDNWAADKIDLPEAWDITTSSSEVVVGVIDTGIDATHPDLAGNVDTEMSFDFVDGNSEEPSDPYGHGTHVAGIISAIGNNNEGISGVCWNIKLVSLRVLDSRGYGYSSYVANAINYAEELDIPILNFSGRWYASSTYFDEALESTIENYGGLFVCAAGNENYNNDEKSVFPANYDLPNLITVGAATPNDTKAVFSNYGKTTVDIFAPGISILSCYPTSICDTEQCEDYTKYAGGECAFWGYHSMSGTSMATPYVAGVAALLLSQYPDLLPCEIKDTILSNVDDCGTTYDTLCVSGGSLNAYNALSNVITHNKELWDLGSDSTHRVSCRSCGYYDTQFHEYQYISQHNASNHMVSCECGDAIYQPHVWNGAKTKCMICNYVNNDFGVLYGLAPSGD